MADYRIDTRTLNSLLTTTLDDYSADMADVIFGSQFAYYMFKQKGVFKSQDGGAYMLRPVLFQVNSTAAWYEGYETVDVTPQDGMTNGLYPWASLAASVSISREEERKNSGRSRLVNLLDKKIFQCEQSMVQKISESFFGEGRYNIAQTTKQMAGLLSLVPEAPASFDAGGLDGDNTWWKNKVLGNSGTDFTWMYGGGYSADATLPTGIAAATHLYNNCKKGAGGAPDIGVCGQYTYEAYENGQGAQRRYPTNEKIAEAGFENLRFKGMTLSWDEYCCSASITAANAASAKTCWYMLNSKFFEIIYDSQSLFGHEGFVRPENQTARTSLVVFMGNAMVTSRKKQGILVDANVTAIR